jgi:hypothetical protein
MNLPARLLFCLCTVAHLLVVFCTARPEWATHAGLDVWELPDLLREVKQGWHEQEGQDEQVRVVCERANARREVIEELRWHRIDLLHAATRFRDIGAAAPDTMHYLRLGDCDGCDDERMCRQVIAWVEGWSGSETEAPGLADELKAELEERLCRDGFVCLPPSGG